VPGVNVLAVKHCENSEVLPDASVAVAVITSPAVTAPIPNDHEPSPFAAVVTVVEPPPGPYREGIHTLSGAGNFTVLDAKSFILDPPMISKRLAHKLARIWETISK